MTLRKKTAQTAPRIRTAKIKSIVTNGTTVDVATSGTASDKIIILFSNRQSQRFELPNGHVVELVHNAIHLAGQKNGRLPQGGYSVNIVDRADWEQVKQIYGAAFKRWFDFGKIIERVGDDEDAAVGLAADNAGDDAGSNPIDPKNPRLNTRPDDKE